MSINIRKCEIKDSASVAELNRAEMGYDYSEDDTCKKLKKLLDDPSHLILVAENDGEVMGYVHAELYDLLYFNTMVNIMGVAVSSKCRRMGIGRALMTEVENWSVSVGADAIRLVSGSQRKDAHKFYERMGYVGGKTQINFRKNL